jgi:tetratricopeptide (TPR) repeat protein
MKKILIPFLSLVLCCSSCKKFLDEYSQNSTYAETAQDLDELMIGECYGVMNHLFDPGIEAISGLLRVPDDEDFMPWLHGMDDDSQESAAGIYNGLLGRTPLVEYSGFHRWQRNPFVNSLNNVSTNISFKKLYRHIAVVNTILFKIPQILEKGGDANKLRKIEGECHFLRAQYYFMLVNLYARPYSRATASSDPGVPLKITEYVDDQTFPRASVKEVYDQILSDLILSSEKLQGIVQPTKYRVNQSAAFGLLSRVYLYMEDYENCIAYADKALSSNSTIYDLNAYTAGTSFTFRNSPETIFSHGNYTMHWLMPDDYSILGSAGYSASTNLIENFETTDLRLNAFFKLSNVGKKRLAWKLRAEADGIVSDVYLMRVPELYLNKAEAQAALGLDENARSTLQLLRKNRFSPANLKDITASGAALVQFARDERRRELCFEGHRWFDLRRYAVNSRFPQQITIRHNALSYTNGAFITTGYFQLNTYAQDQAAYIMPIPDYEIEFSKGMILNEVRPERTLMK